MVETNKLSLSWDPAPYRVVGIKGSQVTAKRGGVIITRNSSHFKRIVPYVGEVDDPYYSYAEEEEEGEMAGNRQREDEENEIGVESELSEKDNDDGEQENQQMRYPRRENRGSRPQYYEEEKVR